MTFYGSLGEFQQAAYVAGVPRAICEALPYTWTDGGILEVAGYLVDAGMQPGLELVTLAHAINSLRPAEPEIDLEHPSNNFIGTERGALERCRLEHRGEYSEPISEYFETIHSIAEGKLYQRDLSEQEIEALKKELARNIRGLKHYLRNMANSYYKEDYIKARSTRIPPSP